MPDRSAERRKSFEFAKAICAHEGLYPTPEVTARHERIIAGEITTEEGIALAIEAAKARAAAGRASAPTPELPWPISPPTGSAPSITTVAQRREAHDQALASCRLSGFEPDEAFLADSEAVIQGTMTSDEARAAILARALAAEAEADRLDAERAAGRGA